MGVPTDDIFLAAIARKQRLEGRQQRHEERFALRLGQILDRAGKFGRNFSMLVCAAKSLHRGPRPVRRQFQQPGRAGKLTLPIIYLSFEHIALQPFPLPRRIVRILDRQFGKRRSRPGLSALYNVDNSRIRTLRDHPSETMWCMVRERSPLRLPSEPA